MKNASSIAKELAIFYGIEFIETDKAERHSFIAMDGVERALRPENFAAVFGLGNQYPDSVSPFEMHGTSLENMPFKTALHPISVFAKPADLSREPESNSTSRYQFAMAA